MYPGAKVAAYSDVLGHNIPQAMWNFLNLKGVLRKNGSNLEEQSLANWIFVMGYPISEPFDEVNLADGRSYKVQYFERNRFEHHPENAGTPYEVLLGLLGSEVLAARRR